MEAGRSETAAAAMRAQGLRSGRRGRFPAWWPAVGPPVPRPWSLLTMDPNHVLQDEDPLCQDLQGFPQLLHPLALAESKWPGSRPFCFSVCVVPAVPIPTSPLLSPSLTAIIHFVPGMVFKFLFEDKEPEAQRG